MPKAILSFGTSNLAYIMEFQASFFAGFFLQEYHISTPNLYS